jgi:hypothetical protein
MRSTKALKILPTEFYDTEKNDLAGDSLAQRKEKRVAQLHDRGYSEQH